MADGYTREVKYIEEEAESNEVFVPLSVLPRRSLSPYLEAKWEGQAGREISIVEMHVLGACKVDSTLYVRFAHGIGCVGNKGLKPGYALLILIALETMYTVTV